MSRFRIIALIWLLAGCQQLPDQTAMPGAVLFGGGQYLLADYWPAQPQQLLQNVVWSDKTQQHHFLINLLLTSEQMLLVAISPLGQELWRLQYQAGHQLTVSGIAPFSEPEFARQLLAQMQLALFNVEELTPRLQQLQLTQPDNNTRALFTADGNQLLMITAPASFSPGQNIHIMAPAYQLTITTLQQELL